MRTTRQQSDPNRFAQELFDALPDRYDRLAEWLSFGQNGRWRRAMVGRIVPAGPALVLDVASGTAGVAIQLARRSPNTMVVATDLTLAMLRCGQRKVQEAGLSRRIPVGITRGEQLPFPDATFDALTFTYLLRYVADPQAALCELARVVKPGGAAASLEFSVPKQPVWAASWWLYTRIVLPAAGWVTGGREWFDVGRFLGPSISGHYRRYPIHWHVDAWQKAGFVDVGVRVMSLGGGLVMWGTRADD